MNTDGTPYATGLSGDLGWNDDRTPGMSVMESAVLAVVTCAYFGSIWLTNGLTPFVYLASQISAPRGRIAADRLTQPYEVRSQRS
jgi:hypothetical protein